MMEFATINAINTRTGCTPFYLNYGIHPTSPISMLHQQQISTNETTTALIDHMKQILQEAQKNLQNA